MHVVSLNNLKPMTGVCYFLLHKERHAIIDVRFYMSQHEIYIKRLKKAISSGDDFAHKECCRDTKENFCAFGQSFYRDIMPNLEEFPEPIREVILQIENVHCEFHEIGKQIDTKNSDDALVKKCRTNL